MDFAVPPNDPRIAILVAAAEVDEVPAAEVWRHVGTAAERVGMSRPSYGHVRRLVRIERRRRELDREGRAVLGRAASTAAAGRVPSAVFVLERLRAIEARKELVLQEHKAFDPRAGSGRGRRAAAGDESEGGVWSAGGEGATGPARRSRGP